MPRFALNLLPDLLSRDDFCEFQTRLYIVRSYQSLTSKPRRLVHGVGLNDVDSPTGYIDPISGETRTKQAFSIWRGMLSRCYSRREQVCSPTYKGCTVASEWLKFSNFKRWFDANCVPGFDLDKDLVQPGNKIYCPEFCRFVPHYLNTLTITGGAMRGSFPIGVSFDARGRKFVAGCQVGGEHRRLGRFDDPMSAHRAWQLAKADVIDATVRRYIVEEAVVHVDVLKALLAYADRLRNDAALGLETLGY